MHERHADPRSLALVLYGDLDVSRIDRMPPGRQRVDTFVVDESYRARLDAFIRKNVAAGGQVYIVCPAVEQAEGAEGGGRGGTYPADGGFCRRDTARADSAAAACGGAVRRSWRNACPICASALSTAG